MALPGKQSGESLSPILNNPYEEPIYHYDTDMKGNLDYSNKREGRRPFTTEVNIGNSQGRKKQGELFTGDELYMEDDHAKFINTMREEVKNWRTAGYPRATRITRELMTFWFNNPERQDCQKLFFCQREAVETAIYLNEVADTDPNIGRSLLHQLEKRQHSMSSNYNNILPRTAFKMATGTGKTVVMAMLILYHYINKKEYPQDTRFVDHFLVVAPGITIRDRLCVLLPDNSRNSNDYYTARHLVPDNHRHWIDGLRTAITITNYHVFEPKVFQGKKVSPMDGKIGGKDGKEDFSNVLSRVLGRNMKGKRYVVINDEAHHCYLPRTDKKANEDSGEDENAKAMVWFEGLRQMKQLGYKIGHVYDLSATPYYLKGSGYEPYSLFPWVVSDFGLVDAIESGLVKIPFLPTYDNTQDLDEAKLKNIYEHISKDLPKKGIKGQKKANKEKGDETYPIAATPKLPALLTLALDQFVKDYEAYNKGSREEGEKQVNLFSTPPVFIVVCNNTAVSNEVYKYIAGYPTKDADGKPTNVQGHWDIFSNYEKGTNAPKKRPPTLLIDSEAINEAGGTIDEAFRATFADEIENFKREYAILHGAGSADKLTDGDILREVVNTVGKQGALGGHVRCVVSVSMLTEGWDANTVTHVCGVRAFGSQLLCEQVAGRALRRMDYTLKKYDAKTGEELPEDTKRTKDVVLKFPPEYAHIIGVPFKNFKGGKTSPPPEPKPFSVIKALPDRKHMEIRFPNIVSYRTDTPEGVISADFANTPKFSLRFDEIPTETVLGNPIENIEENKVVLKSDYQSLRDNQVIYELTHRLLNRYYFSLEGGRQFHLFGTLKHIVEQWYDSQVDIIGGDDDPMLMRRLVIFWDEEKTSANIYEGIRQASRGNERITSILNYYNPEGSTSHVFGKTTKPVFETKKSHVNYVVADTDSWEQIAAKTLEDLPQVKYYVKNHFLGFTIPYMIDGEEHQYVTDFIAKVTTPNGGETNLIIEISGFSDNRIGHKDAKRYYTENYWLPAANNLGDYGRWAFIEITDIANIKQTIIQKINSL